MGAEPITAINLVMFDTCKVPFEYLRKILEGGADKLREAEVSLVGGHTVEDLETKYGLCATGTVHPEEIVRNSTARPGDLLIYTKPLGIGILTTAIKADMATPEEVKEATEVMATLNKSASKVMVKVGVNACTDITGFGFLGHLYEMVKFSGVSATVFSSKIPLLPGAKEYASMGLLPAATYENFEYAGKAVSFSEGFDQDLKMLLFDPQTSGGLLISVPESKGEELLSKLKEAGVKWAALVGKIEEGEGIKVI